MASLPYVLPLALAAVLCGSFIVIALPQRDVPGIRWFVVFMAAVVVWCLAYSAELLLPGLAQKVLAGKVEYLGISVVGLGWLGFTTEYTGLSWGSRRNILLALTIPVATLALVWTNGLHHLVWSSVALSTGRAYSVLAVGHGPWFWVQVGYSYLCLLAALALLGRMVFHRPRLFSGQATLLLLGSIPPWVGNALYVTGAVDTDLDLTVFGFALSGVIAGWAILRWKLLDIGPIARDTIVDGMSEAVAVIDREGRVVDVNPAGAEAFGAPVGRLVGWDAKEVLGRFLPPLEWDTGNRCQVDGRGGRTFDCRVDPLHDRGGRFQGWTLVLHDVTERAAEAAALERARTIAETTARAQRSFLANMNHELRTPLNGIMGMLHLLRTSELDGEQAEYAEAALASGERLSELLARIMDYTATETGAAAPEEVQLGIASVLSDAVGGVRERARSKGVELKLEVDDAIPDRILGDARRLEQVVGILTDNAVKFTDEGSVAVRAFVQGGGDAEALVRIEVRDTGIGIPADRLGSVFSGFIQVDDSSTRRHEGAGLGLALANRLVAAMGGELHVESEVGQGSSFWFVLRFGRVRAAEAESAL